MDYLEFSAPSPPPPSTYNKFTPCLIKHASIANNISKIKYIRTVQSMSV